MAEVPDGASQEEHQEPLSFFPPGGHFEEAVEIFALEADNSNGFDIAQFALADGQGGCGNLDRKVIDMPTARECFENPASFSAAAAAQLTHRDVAGNALTISWAWARSRRSSARVNPYSGSSQIASNSFEPSVS